MKKPFYHDESVGGLAGIGGPVGMNTNVFVSQIQGPCFIRPKYAVSNDIISKNIVTTDSEGILKKVPSSYITGNKKVAVYKYKGPSKEEKLEKILRSLGSPVGEEFIYETLSNKELLTDFQINLDENFEPINFDNIRASIINDAHSVQNKYIYSVSPTLANMYTVVESTDARQKLFGHSPNIVIMEDLNHNYFAMNKETLRRTSSYLNILDIYIGGDLYEDN